MELLMKKNSIRNLSNIFDVINKGFLTLIYTSISFGIVISTIYFSQIHYFPTNSESSLLSLYFKVSIFSGLLIGSIGFMPAMPSFIVKNSLKDIHKKLQISKNSKDKSINKPDIKNSLYNQARTSFLFFTAPFLTITSIYLLIAFIFHHKPNHFWELIFILSSFPIEFFFIYYLARINKISIAPISYLELCIGNYLLLFVTGIWFSIITLLKKPNISEYILLTAAYLGYIVFSSIFLEDAAKKYLLIIAFSLIIGFQVCKDDLSTEVFKELKLTERNIKIYFKPESCRDFNRSSKFQLSYGIDGYCTAIVDLLFIGDNVTNIRIYNLSNKKIYSDRSLSNNDFTR